MYEKYAFEEFPWFSVNYEIFAKIEIREEKKKKKVTIWEKVRGR